MIERNLAFYLKRDSGYYPVVTLTGPRQSGKTTLVRQVFPDHRYRSLEDVETRQFVREDPRGFLRECADPVILDEVQHCPDLISYIQTDVDRDDTPGRFILTGSAPETSTLIYEGDASSERNGIRVRPWFSI